MSKQTTLIQATVAALLLAVASSQSAYTAPQEIVKLPRVVVTGKAAPDVQVAKVEVLPRVVVLGKATVQMAQVTALPRVVVTGYSIATQLQQQTLAAATPVARTI